MPARLVLLGALALAACAPSAPLAQTPMPADAAPDWRQHDTTRPQPPRVEPAPARPPVPPPGDAVVLIGPDGSGLEHWQAEGGGEPRWRTEGGALVATPGAGGIRTEEAFGDVQLHVEWMPASEPEKTGQDRSNSGIFLVDGRYEVQVLDVWDNPTYADGRAAAVYGQFPPLADATRPPDEWQSYDVFFRMPRFSDDGEVLEPARMTVLHNGVLVQNNEALPGITMWLETLPYAAHGEGRIGLQDHGSPVRFRNLWVRRIGERPDPPPAYFDVEPVALSDAEYDRLVGAYDRENDGGQFVVERTPYGVGMSMPWRPGVLRMIPVSATSFELEKTAGRLEFTLGPDGEPGALTFTMGGGVYRAVPAGDAGGG